MAKGSTADPWGEFDEGATQGPGIGFEDDFVAGATPTPSPINFIPRVHDDSLPTETKTTTLPLVSFPPLRDPRTPLSSEEYVARLEARLIRIKSGGGKGLSTPAKKMIDALAGVRESRVRELADGSVERVFVDESSDGSRIQLNPNALVQRMFPEKSPLTAEELEWLINHDQLECIKDCER